MRLPAPCSPAKRQAAAAAVEMAAAPPCSLLAGQEAGRQRRRGGRWPCASLLGLPEGDGWGRAQWSAGGGDGVERGWMEKLLVFASFE